MVSKPSSGIGALLRHLPKAYRTLVSASTLFVACSVTLFAFAIPPALSTYSGGLFGGAASDLAGNTAASDGDGASNATNALDAAGGLALPSANLAPIGATSLGNVIATATAAVNEEGQVTAQNPQGAPSAAGEQAPLGDTTNQETQPTDPPIDPSTDESELRAAESELTADFYNAQDHYAMLSNVVAGLPILWSPGGYADYDVNLWNDLPWAYELSRKCISEASAYEGKCADGARKFPAYEKQYNTINNTWSMLSSASRILIDFLDAVRACPDPATHSECFMGIVEGHVVGVSSGGQTVYTLKELENARQLLNQF